MTANETNNEVKEKSTYFGVRHLQSILIFLAFTLSYAMRVNLSIAIVAMTDTENGRSQMTYDWTEKIKSYVLSSFFFGSFMTQLPGGKLALKFGGKPILNIGVLLMSIFNLLTPVAAQIGNWQLVCTVRFLSGFFQGVMAPSVHTVLSKWLPVSERGMLGTFCYMGSRFGTIFILSVSGELISSAWGWPSIFYTSGSLGVLWSMIYFRYGASTPGDSKIISARERNLIEKSLSATQHNSENKLRIPWFKIFTSVPFLMIVVANCTNNWVNTTLLTQIPTYLKNVLFLDIKSNALLSALPYVTCLLLGFVFSAMSKLIHKHHYMSETASRKLFNTISQWIPAVTLVGLSYLDAQHTMLAIIFLVISVGLNIACYAGFNINHIDLSPNFAGILMGITNTAGNFMNFVAPLVVGFVVKDETDPLQWRIVFSIASSIYFFGNLLYILFASAKVQPWNSAVKAKTDDLKGHDNDINLAELNS